jgi:hypothetical protein
VRLKTRKLLLAIGFPLSLAACTTQPGTIFQKYSLADNESITTGSRQRTITNVPVLEGSRPGLVDPKRIVCAEPSPDVAVALVNSLNVGVSVFNKGSGTISRNQAEGIAQLAERTASIQALRDQMYQACLAYSNGAITGTTYSIVMGRLNDTMVTLILGEVAGGAVGRRLAGIGTKTSSNVSAPASASPERIASIDEARTKLAAAEKKVTQKQEKLKAAKEAVSDKENPTTKEQATITKAENELQQAKVEQNALLTLLKYTVNLANQSAAGVGTLTTAGEISHAPSPEIANTVRDMQEAFLAKDFSDVYVSACLIELGLKQAVIRGTDEKFYQAAVENWIRARKQADNNPDNSGLVEIADLAKGTVLEASAALRTSALAEYCEDHLDNFVREVFNQNTALRNDRLKVKQKDSEVRREEAAAKTFVEFSNAVATCQKLDSSQKKMCMEALNRMK